MKVFMLYDKERCYPLHGVESVDTVRVFSNEEKAKAEASRLASECEYPKGDDLHEEWVVVPIDLE
jgi:hypothetical protein